MAKNIFNKIRQLNFLRICGYLPAEWELLWMKKLMSVIKRGDIVIDVGAFIGAYSVTFAKRIKNEGKVYAFEPNPNQYKILKKNIKSNRVSEFVETFNMAISDRCNVIYLSNQSSESHIVAFPHSSKTAKKDLPQIYFCRDTPLHVASI